MKFLTNFAGQNWLITPAALAVPPHDHPPANIHDQKWLLVLSGVVLADLKGNSSAQWLHETLSFIPDMAGPSNSGPLNWAISQFTIPKPPGPPSGYNIVFSLVEWAPFASLSSIFNQNQSINSGASLWTCGVPTTSRVGQVLSHATVTQIFTGIDVDVAVRDTDASILKLGYNITLLGSCFHAQRHPLRPGRQASTAHLLRVRATRTQEHRPWDRCHGRTDGGQFTQRARPNGRAFFFC